MFRDGRQRLGYKAMFPFEPFGFERVLLNEIICIFFLSLHSNIVSLTLSSSLTISVDLFLLYIDLTGSRIRSCNAVHLQQEKEDIKYGFLAFNSSVFSLIQHRFLMSFQGTACLLLTMLVTKPKQVILEYLTSSSANSLRICICANPTRADSLSAFQTIQ